MFFKKIYLLLIRKKNKKSQSWLQAPSYLPHTGSGQILTGNRATKLHRNQCIYIDEPRQRIWPCWRLDKLEKISAEDPLSLPFQAAQVPVENLTPLCREGMIYLAAGLSLPGSFLIDLWKQRLHAGSSKDEVIGFALRPEILAKPDGFNKTKLVSLLLAQTGWAFLLQHQARIWTEDSSPCTAWQGDS